MQLDNLGNAWVIHTRQCKLWNKYEETQGNFPVNKKEKEALSLIEETTLF